MIFQQFLISSLLFFPARCALLAGVGIADVTGPVAEVNFVGYGKFNQKGTGLHLRQFSRAFIFSDGSHRLAFVSVDSGLIGDAVRKKVLRTLQKRYGSLYSEQNVMISASHSHSTPGGHLLHMLFDITILGFSKDTFDAYVTGISKSIMRAHENMQPARIHVSKGEILGASINRSPTAYQNNPPGERKEYKYNVDKSMVLLKIQSAEGSPMGAVVWYAVHPTSMNNTNTLVSSDNVGYAAILFEQWMNPNGLIGKGPFVSAFASTNLGDVSPNTGGPRCVLSGAECDPERSTCEQKGHECIASGPGKDMFDSTRIIAEKLFEKAKDLWDDSDFEVFGPLKVAHQYLDVPSSKILIKDPVTSETKLVQGCVPAMGYSFGAGTTDGPGVSVFSQSTTSAENPLWNAFRDIVSAPRQEDIACHSPKPILIPTGRMNFPFEWQPRIVSTQIAFFEDLALVCVPGEFTTMAGRRLRKAVSEVFPFREVVIVGLCNSYSDYVTTFEEYQVQRYEGASTIFGPHTLEIYLNQYRNLTKALLENKKIARGPEPPNRSPKAFSLIPPVVYDTSEWSHDFGYVTLQPNTTVRRGEIVTARFVSGHPRNDLRLDDTYLTVERLLEDDSWSIVATDANWETKFHWIRKNNLTGTSEVFIEWSVPNKTPPGVYRIRHFGKYKYVLGGVHPYQGVTQPFRVVVKKWVLFPDRKTNDSNSNEGELNNGSLGFSPEQLVL